MFGCNPQEIRPVVLSPVAPRSSIPSRFIAPIPRHVFPVPRQHFRRLKNRGTAESALDCARGHPESSLTPPNKIGAGNPLMTFLSGTTSTTARRVASTSSVSGPAADSPGELYTHVGDLFEMKRPATNYPR